MKHISVRMLAIQEWVAGGRISNTKIHAEVNPSDILTKGLAERKLILFGRMLRLRGNAFDNAAYDMAVAAALCTRS